LITINIFIATGSKSIDDDAFKVVTKQFVQNDARGVGISRDSKGDKGAALGFSDIEFRRLAIDP